MPRTALPRDVHDARKLEYRTRRRGWHRRPTVPDRRGARQGRLSARLRAANYPRRWVDRTLLPDFRGVLETDDGATVLFSWRGYAHRPMAGMRRLVGCVTHVTDDDRYRHLNDSVCALTGEVRPQADGGGFEVVLDVAELIWEPALV